MVTITIVKPVGVWPGVYGSPFGAGGAYDLKIGSAILTLEQIAQIQANLPPGFQDIPISEIRP